MRRNGFTLIELLVVIAIIAVLFAILFPVFAKTREQARKTHCVNNMKQIYLAFRLYAEDFDGWWPSYSMPGGGGPWPFFLTKTGYAGGPIRKPKPFNNYNVSEIFFCPSDTVAGKGPNYNGRNDAFTSYGLNSSWEDAKYGYCG